MRLGSPAGQVDILQQSDHCNQHTMNCSKTILLSEDRYLNELCKIKEIATVSGFDPKIIEK